MLLHGRKEDHGLRHDGQSPLAGQTRRPSCEGPEAGSDGPAGDLPLLPAPRRSRRPAGRSERRRWTGSRSFQTQGPPPERSRGAGSPSRPHSPPCRAYSRACGRPSARGSGPEPERGFAAPHPRPRGLLRSASSRQGVLSPGHPLEPLREILIPGTRASLPKSDGTGQGEALALQASPQLLPRHGKPRPGALPGRGTPALRAPGARNPGPACRAWPAALPLIFPRRRLPWRCARRPVSPPPGPRCAGGPPLSCWSPPGPPHLCPARRVQLLSTRPEGGHP